MNPVRLDSHFTVEPGSVIPGHLIVRTQPPVLQLDALAPEALAALGSHLARLMTGIRQVIHAERVYVLRFGEEVEAIHFHLFPRTRVMAEHYRAAHPGLLSGARMFDWARRPEIAARLQAGLSAEQAFEQIMKASR